MNFELLFENLRLACYLNSRGLSSSRLGCGLPILATEIIQYRGRHAGDKLSGCDIAV